jgi:hypothetical protein
VPYVRTVKTASGATAVQIVYSSHRGSRDIEHFGSAHDDVELELLKAAARQRLAAVEPARPETPVPCCRSFRCQLQGAGVPGRVARR